MREKIIGQILAAEGLELDTDDEETWYMKMYSLPSTTVL